MTPASPLMPDTLRLQLCDIQGRLFELAGRQGLDSEPFLATFMNSPTAAHYDLPYDAAQWRGEEYLLAEVADEAGPEALPKTGAVFPNEVLYWAGYLYRHWHFLTGESSAEIYAQADAATMLHGYAGLHTIDNDLAVEDLKEWHRLAGGQTGGRGTAESPMT